MNQKITKWDPAWLRSSRCVPDNNCVEVRLDRDRVGVRDSKNAGGATLAFRRDHWVSFLANAVR